MSTLNDKQVLSAILNPNTPFDDPDAVRPVCTSKYELTNDINEAKALESKGVKEAEQNNLKAAIDCFQSAIQLAPHWASAYNNRAQAYRLNNDIDAALKDLESAISFATQYEDTNVLALALTQKGTILRLKGKDDEALDCFKVAAAHGNTFAKQQTVCLNPYAAMCNKMLADVFRNIKNGQQN